MIFPEVPQHVCCQGDAEDEADQGYGGEGGSVVAQEQRQRMIRRRRSSRGLLHKIVRFETYLPVGTFPGGRY